jgi:antitoxin CcdA
MRTREIIQRSFNFCNNSDVQDASKQQHVCGRELERKWREEHAEFIVGYNDTIQSEGLPLDKWKSF